ncbi:hypothetical protein T439DRAFT_348722 [Meredithblackwellia eburnea MCA 4105]
MPADNNFAADAQQFAVHNDNVLASHVPALVLPKFTPHKSAFTYGQLALTYATLQKRDTKGHWARKIILLATIDTQKYQDEAAEKEALVAFEEFLGGLKADGGRDESIMEIGEALVLLATKLPSIFCPDADSSNELPVSKLAKKIDRFNTGKSTAHSPKADDIITTMCRNINTLACAVRADLQNVAVDMAANLRACLDEVITLAKGNDAIRSQTWGRKDWVPTACSVQCFQAAMMRWEVTVKASRDWKKEREQWGV